MNTEPDKNEAARLEAINRELCQKIVDLEADIERKNKTLEGFMAENEALKAELGGKRETRAGGKDTGPSRSQSLDDLVARARRLGF